MIIACTGYDQTLLRNKQRVHFFELPVQLQHILITVELEDMASCYYIPLLQTFQLETFHEEIHRAGIQVSLDNATWHPSEVQEQAP